MNVLFLTTDISALKMRDIQPAMINSLTETRAYPIRFKVIYWCYLSLTKREFSKVQIKRRAVLKIPGTVKCREKEKRTPTHPR